MNTPPRKDHTNQKSSDAESAAKHKPIYGLVVLGTLVLFIGWGITRLPNGLLFAPMPAAVLSAGFTMVLYGIYPAAASLTTGRFDQIFGQLSVVGPAAIGLALFFFIWNGLKNEVARELTGSELARGFILLQNLPDPNLNTYQVASNHTIRLCDVDSLSDDHIADNIAKIISVVEQSGWKGKEGRAIASEIFTNVVKALKFGSRKDEAAAFFSKYGLDADQKLNSDWTILVKECATVMSEDKRFRDRVKLTPFAIVTIQEPGKSRIEVLLPKSEFRAGNQDFSVPVIANPKIRVTPGINEAIVLHRRIAGAKVAEQIED